MVYGLEMSQYQPLTIFNGLMMNSLLIYGQKQLKDDSTFVACKKLI